MKSKIWVWFLAGWLLSLFVSPNLVLGMFKGGGKKA